MFPIPSPKQGPEIQWISGPCLPHAPSTEDQRGYPHIFQQNLRAAAAVVSGKDRRIAPEIIPPVRRDLKPEAPAARYNSPRDRPARLSLHPIEPHLPEMRKAPCNTASHTAADAFADTSADQPRRRRAFGTGRAQRAGRALGDA